MHDIATLKYLNDKATKKARKAGAVPIVPTEEQRAQLTKGDLLGAAEIGFKVPFLGEYTPKGWQETDDEYLFVDASGFGQRGEPALTFEQFALVIAKDEADIGYAIVEEGHFQCYVARYRKGTVL